MEMYKTPENIKKIIKCQTICKRWLSCKNNIYIKLKKQQHQFNIFIKGYHMINKTPIKDIVWEEINCYITYKASGNHVSGKDIGFDNINISAKKNNNIINISSYRLTSVCNSRTPGNEKDIIYEIEKRDKSFDYYYEMKKRTR